MLFGPNGFVNHQETEDANVTIFWAGKSFYFFNREDTLAKNIGIAIMASIGVFQNTICEIFRVGRNTITRIKNIYTANGLEGLQGYRQGPQRVEEELKDFIVKKYIELKGIRGYQNKILSAVQEKYDRGEFKSNISRGKMHVIIKEYEEERERIKRENEERIRRLEEKRKKREEEGEEEKGDDGQGELIEDIGGEGEVCVERGGAAVSTIFLEEFGIMNHVPEIEAEEEDSENRFSNRELATTYALLNAAKVVTVEQRFKHLPSYEMGGIIGRNKIPSLGTYRGRIPKIVDRMDMRDVIFETSKSMMELLSFSFTVYIDGHFMPYYGRSDTLYGYNPQRRLAMKGREYYFVHDEDGIPVYATISDGYRDMKVFIGDVDNKLRGIYGAAKKQLLEIFDRGGYSKEFCVGIADSIRFLCWRSDARSVPEIEQKEWTKVMIRHQGNTIYRPKKPQIYYAWERIAEFKVGEKKAKFREIWIRRGKKISPALTNDFELALEELVKKLVRRWGVQENQIKKLKEHGIDKIHSYLKEDYDEEQLYERGLEDPSEGISHVVDNPKVKKLNRKISTLMSDRRKVADKILELEKKENKKALDENRRKLYNLNSKIKKYREKRAPLPKKVLLFDKIQEEGIERLRDDKKLFFDWLKMAALWARHRVIKIVKPYYEDLRDVEKYVDSILNSRTYVRRKDETLHIDFPEQHSGKKEEVLQELCEELNKCKSIDLGLCYKRAIFSVRKND